MIEMLLTLLTPLLIAVVVVFLIYRFDFFSGRDVGGRHAFWSGGLILFLVAGWQVVELAPDYESWFVLSAYGIIDLVEFVVGSVGLLLVVVGLALYADYWQVRREEVEERHSRLAILENLQHDARQPYHLLELLDISLREILMHYPLGAGAIFLVNRTRRQFVLTGSSGLKKEEVAHLEYYPLERNIVSQAVELGDPMLVSRFDFVDRSGRQIASRFRSVLILPMMSGLDKIGGLLLFSEEPQFFGREDIRHLSPVAQWLAEKIKSARLTRELAQTEKKRDSAAQRLADLVARFNATARAAVSSEAAAGFCRGLVGLVESESVHLCAVEQGSLVFLGDSEPLFDLSENFRAALIDGMSRAKPLIINQESTEAGETPTVVQSSLIHPLAGHSGTTALLFIKSGPPFVIDDSALKLIESLGHLANMIIQVEEQQRSRLTRRKGIDAVLKLLHTDEVAAEPSSVVEPFLDMLGRAFPPRTPCLAFAPETGGVYRAVHSVGVPDQRILDGLELLSDEGGIERVVESRESFFVYGKSRIGIHLESYHDQNRSIFQHLFGERGLPDFIAFCPLTRANETVAVVLIMIYGSPENERGEWERLITLAAGLYSLRLTMKGLSDSISEGAATTAAHEISAGSLNQLNNNLSAVIGTAELSLHRTDLTEETRRQLKHIIETGNGLNRIIEAELARLHVSGNLYMAGQRPREIRLDLGSVPTVGFSSREMEELFRSVLNRFAVGADESDVLTIATYARDNYVYLDISRHGSNFPAVQEVAGFGRFVPCDEALRHRPGDIFLRHLEESDSYYAVDTAGSTPAFLSFKFPMAAQTGKKSLPPQKPPVRLLAIDDQSVILDLVKAMGQSLGYEVRTASTGEEGLTLAESGRFDLVLTDLALPGISGLEVAQRIVRNHPDTPIILVTGWATEMGVEELRAAGICDVLYKPFRIEQLTAAVQSVISSRTPS